MDELEVPGCEVNVAGRDHHDLVGGDALARDDRKHVGGHRAEQHRAHDLRRAPPNSTRARSHCQRWFFRLSIYK